MNLPNVDLSKSYIPSLIVIAICGAIGAGGISLGRTLETTAETRTQLDRLTSTVDNLTNTLRRLESVVASWQPNDAWKKSDHLSFCLEAERLNPSWKCPSKLISE